MCVSRHQDKKTDHFHILELEESSPPEANHDK